MLTVCKSVVLGAAFLAGIGIAACADPPCHTTTGPCRPPSPQIAALPFANVAPAPDSGASYGASHKVPHVDAKDR
jgi:hypothetical protein